MSLAEFSAYRYQLLDKNQESIDVMTPPEVARSCLSLGKNGTTALLSSEHTLLQLSAFNEQKHTFTLVREYMTPTPTPDEVAPEPQYADPTRKLLLQCQNFDNNSGGWGLSLITETPHQVKSGFMECRWPTRKVEVKVKDSEGNHQDIVEQITTYVEDGKLIQIMAVASTKNSLVKWTLGGKIQLLRRSRKDDLLGKEYYTVDPHDNGHILTIGCDLGALDIQVFVDGRQQLPNQHVTEIQSDGVNINWSADMELKPELVSFVIAIFSIRESQDPTSSPCPCWKRVKRRLGLSQNDQTNPLVQALEKNRSIAQLTGIPYIVTRHVAQILSVAALAIPGERTELLKDISGSFNVTVQASFWHVRFLTQVLLLLRVVPAADSYVNDISAIIIGTVRMLVRKYIDPEDLENRAFRALTIFYVYAHIDDVTPLCYPLNTSMARALKPQSRSLDDFEGSDSLTRLLQWCHLAIFSQMDQQYELDQTEMERLEYGALYETKPRTITTEMGRLGKDHLDPQIARQEQWNQLALVLIELFRDKPLFRPFINKLVNEVSNRLDNSRSRILGNQPPWGYRCLDHSLQIEVTIAKANLQESNDAKVLERIQSSYNDCSYFLQSNFSYVKSWSIRDSEWINEFWDLDCSSQVCSSFLSVAILDGSAGPSGNVDGRKSLMPLSMEALLRSITEARGDLEQRQDHVIFPWKENLRVRFGYPRFMTDQFEDHNAVSDRDRLREKLNKLSLDNIAPKLKQKIVDGIPPSFLDLPSWSLTDLEVQGDQMCIADYPFERTFISAGEIRSRLEKSRLEIDSPYRIMTIASSSKTSLLAYMFFAHSDAWETVVDYFDYRPIFRPAVESHDSYPQAFDEVTPWLTSITIPHLILNTEPWSIDDMGVREPITIPAHLEAPHPNAVIVEACIAVCMTGDNLGEFWTTSILGTVNACSLQGNLNKLTSVDVTSSAKEILDMYRYDRCSARCLVFVVHLSEISHIVSNRHENLAQELSDIMKLHTMEFLYRRIVEADLSKPTEDLFRDVTDALRRILWAAELLERLAKTLKSALSTFEDAVNHIDAILTKRRQYWQISMQDFEHDHVWETYRKSLSRLSALETRVDALSGSAAGSKDNLIHLTNMVSSRSSMASTIAIQATAEDSSGMKIIAILTAGFLPFTFMAVLFTTPIFKWADPDEGSVISKLPFILYWAISVVLTIIIGACMMYILGGIKANMVKILTSLKDTVVAIWTWIRVRAAATWLWVNNRARGNQQLPQ